MLNVRVEKAPQIVHDPLAYTRSQILFSKETHRIKKRDDENRDGGEFENMNLVRTNDGSDRSVQPAAPRAAAAETIEGEFQRPRLEEGRSALAHACEQSNGEELGVRLQQFDKARPASRRARRGVRRHFLRRFESSYFI